jgi:CRISPR-associated endoribonuclease Cas6
MIYTKITIKIDAKPPYFIGSQIRGALGYALKKVTCINPTFKCEGCFASTDCLYYKFYEEKNNFHKYRLDYILGEDKYNFNIFLFNETVDKLPYVISALYQMITEIGFGVDRKTYKNFQIFVNDISIYENENLTIPQNYKKEFKIDKYCQNVSLKFITPLRIKKNGKFLRNAEELSLYEIINSIYQRNLKLNNLDFQKINFEIEGEITKKDLNYKKLTRQSNRQKTKMQMDGLIGEIELKNLDENSYKILKLGEIIGVGKSAVFGLGKIEIKEINCK